MGGPATGDAPACPRCDEVSLERLPESDREISFYACPACGAARYPGDEELGVVQTSRSPGLQRQTARLGAKEPFAEVAKDLKELAGISLSPSPSITLLTVRRRGLIHRHFPG